MGRTHFTSVTEYYFAEIDHKRHPKGMVNRILFKKCMYILLNVYQSV